MDQQLSIGLPRGWRGRMEVEGLDLQLRGEQLQRLQGELRFLDLVDEQGHDMGNYRVVFPAASAAPFNGQLNDTGGPLEIRATLGMGADRSWTLNGTVAVRTGDGAMFKRYLEALARRTPPGVIRSPPPAASSRRRTGEFPEFAQPRKIQRGAYRFRPECTCQLHVELQLRRIAREFAGQELREATTGVHAGLVVHDPAHAIGFDEAAVDHHVAQLAIHDADSRSSLAAHDAA